MIKYVIFKVVQVLYSNVNDLTKTDILIDFCQTQTTIILQIFVDLEYM